MAKLIALLILLAVVTGGCAPRIICVRNEPAGSDAPPVTEPMPTWCSNR